MNPQPDIPGYASLVKTLRADDEPRIQLLRGCLTKLGLEVNSATASAPTLSALHLTALYPDEVHELAYSMDEILSKEGNNTYIRAESDVFELIHSATSDSLATELVAEGGDGVKQLILYENRHPSRSEVPSFDYVEYFKRLQHYRRTEHSDAVEWGNVLMYGKVVTSTNTMLEK